MLDADGNKRFNGACSAGGVAGCPAARTVTASNRLARTSGNRTGMAIVPATARASQLTISSRRIPAMSRIGAIGVVAVTVCAFLAPAKVIGQGTPRERLAKAKSIKCEFPSMSTVEWDKATGSVEVTTK